PAHAVNNRRKDPDGFSDWQNTVLIEQHENSTTHRDSILTYLNRRQGFGLTQKLEKQIKGEREYWQHVLQHVIAVVQTLAERGLPFRGSNDTFGSLQNGNVLGLLELVAQFDPFLAGHSSKYGNAGKGNPSYLSKTLCDELIGLLSDNVRSAIVDEIGTAGYFSLSVDSTSDLSHIDQLRIVLRYVSLTDGKPVERCITFLNLKSHTAEEMATQVMHYLWQVCKVDFSKYRGQSYDNAANMSGCYQGMQKKLLEQNKYAIFIPCAAHSLSCWPQCC
ncbi:zinc finger MYM-type containing 1, partial [Chelydra serpentina]